MNISEIQQHASDLCAKNNWNHRSTDQRMLYLLTEIGELSSELIKLKQNESDLPGLKREIGHEMFDVIWNICDLANLLDIDLEKYANDKRDLNNKRKF